MAQGSEGAGEDSNPHAVFSRALAFLQGSGVQRDLPAARQLFVRAADLGHLQARRIAIALLANGMTGGRDWTAALARLGTLREEGDKFAARQLDLLNAMDLDPEGNPKQSLEPRQVGTSPDAFLFGQFFSPAECRYLAEIAAPSFRPATVGHVAGGRGLGIVEQVRTCDSAAFPWIAEDPVIHALNRRIALASGTSVESGEPLQVLRYRPGQEFKPHRDCTEDRDNQRVLTMLVYLNDDYSGGETLFVESGLRIRGDAGDALLFRNASDDGEPDPHSLHAGLPVRTGEKLIASRWIRQKRFGPTS